MNAHFVEAAKRRKTFGQIERLERTSSLLSNENMESSLDVSPTIFYTICIGNQLGERPSSAG